MLSISPSRARFHINYTIYGVVCHLIPLLKQNIVEKHIEKLLQMCYNYSVNIL